MVVVYDIRYCLFVFKLIKIVWIKCIKVENINIKVENINNIIKINFDDFYWGLLNWFLLKI